MLSLLFSASVVKNTMTDFNPQTKLSAPKSFFFFLNGFYMLGKRMKFCIWFRLAIVFYFLVEIFKRSFLNTLFLITRKDCSTGNLFCNWIIYAFVFPSRPIKIFWSFSTVLLQFCSHYLLFPKPLSCYRHIFSLSLACLLIIFLFISTLILFLWVYKI